MTHPLSSIVAGIAITGLALVPWALSLYLHYWLEHRGVWAVDMPYRRLVSVFVIAVGMGLSFLLHSSMAARAAKQ